AGRLESSGRLPQAIAVIEAELAKGLARDDAPFAYDHLAALYDGLAAQAPEGSPERAAARERAIDARLKLASFVGVAWDFRAIRPAEIEAVERLVRGALRRAAADRHVAGTALLERALATDDGA